MKSTPTDGEKKWETFEKVAAIILNDLCKKLGVDRFEGKQQVLGTRSDTSWEIDAKGVRENDGAIFLVEVRRYTTSKQSQEKLASLAYRILDTGAAGGFVVSVLGLQEGAEKVANAENIISIQLNQDATPEEYIAKFLQEIVVHLDTDVVPPISDSLQIFCIDKHGNQFALEEMKEM